ncbi:porin [Flaviaesturariibacter aridisoli]|uniref:Porin n=1 Tax=Flaviaesturariibacter aridisoli TaxID=2545761 RepID=A0A4R4E535_9BACT|nr:porin [Flaviaesturariibacter aridisoli]TCZ74736.1 porin [Flaviaesturariibacter aridisoli]
MRHIHNHRPYFYRHFRLALAALLLLGCSVQASAQRFLSDYDSTLFVRDTLRPLVNRFENLHFSGYIQPQFQWAETEGAFGFEGGGFSEHSDSRFQLRRARVRVDYQMPLRDLPLPLALFTFQVDVTERGSIVRDMFAKVYLPVNQALSGTFGLFARPFGYEVNLSSAYRESPERARASQVLMPGERDLGLMFSYEPLHTTNGPALKFDAGLFNGPGVNASTDFDSYKDLAGRLALKPWKVSKTLTLSAGLSALRGGWRQDTRYRWEMDLSKGAFTVDSTASNEGAKAPRHYYGGDAQLAWQGGLGKTELRGEFWQGTQPGTAGSTLNPSTQPQGPTYLRPFNAGIFYFLQQLGSERWELGLKYDWYDPNRRTAGTAIGAAGNNLTVADIRYDTWSAGLTWYVSKNLKVLGWYTHPVNERTALAGFTQDVPDDVLTLRTQLRF